MQEEFYLDENVGKAIRINEWAGGALTTSMVDDVFFILQKCGRRALATGSVQCVCAVLGQLNNLLAHDLRAALDAQWKVRWPVCTSASLSSVHRFGPALHTSQCPPCRHRYCNDWCCGDPVPWQTQAAHTCLTCSNACNCSRRHCAKISMREHGLADLVPRLRCMCGAQPAATRLLQAVAAQCGEGAGASGDASQAAEQAAALNNADLSTSCALIKP